MPWSERGTRLEWSSRKYALAQPAALSFRRAALPGYVQYASCAELLAKNLQHLDKQVRNLRWQTALGVRQVCRSLDGLRTMN